VCITKIGPLKQPASLSLFVDQFTIQQEHLQATLFDPFPSPFQEPGMGNSLVLLGLVLLGLVPIFKQVP